MTNPKRIVLYVEFRSEEAMHDWFEDAQGEGYFPEAARIRPVDALDTPGHRASPGEFIVRGEGE
jgi:hypothetical protein